MSAGPEPAAPRTIRVDGAQPPSAATIRALGLLCDQAEAGGGPLVVHVSGTPGPGWDDGLDVASVTRWERVLRRVEQAPVATVAVATGDCGGTALEALLVTDLRVAAPATRLLVTGPGGIPWPGMSGYRLVQQAGVAGVRRALLFGLPLDAAQALGLGLLHEVSAQPEAAIEGLVPAARADLAMRRRLLLDATSTSFDEALGMHLAACDRTLRQVAAAAVAR